MADKALVVKGGTLIDGTGRAPVEHAVVVIEGGRFKAVGRAGQVKEPEGADIIDARGLTILPGSSMATRISRTSTASSISISA